MEPLQTDHPEAKSIWVIDLLRWVSAGLVLLGHARDVLMVDYGEANAHGLIAAIFYFASGLGHQAVIVFFVLSGYLVGGGLWLQCANGLKRNGVLGNYYVSRFSRIYIVLFPALLVTLLLDCMGQLLFSGSRIYGQAGWSHALNFAPAARLGGVTFLCNMINLQEVLCAPFGSNSPLWSLAYEWFYYVTFPAVVLLWLWVERAYSKWPPIFLRAAYGVCLGGFLLMGAEDLGPLGAILAYYPIWLLGAVVRRMTAKRIPMRVIMPLGILMLAGVLTVSRVRLLAPLLADYAMGIAVATLLAGIIPIGRSDMFGRWNYRLAGFSYSLYTLHFPIVVFCAAGLRYAGLLKARLRPDSTSLALLGAVVIVSYGCAWLFSQVTERHTPRLRRLISAYLRSL